MAQYRLPEDAEAFFSIDGKPPVLVASECPLCGEWAQTIEVDYRTEGPRITRYIYGHPDGRVCNAAVS